MNTEVQKRLKWVQLYEKRGDAGVVCRRCGISRPTLRKWWHRYQAQGVEGLRARSRCPHTSPAQKVNEQQQAWIMAMRTQRKLGARRIQTELVRLHDCKRSLATIHNTLTKNAVKPLIRQRKKKDYKRYSRSIPGERVQMDTCKIAPGIYQYTAVDDCSRYRALGVYSRRTAANTLTFLDRVVEQMPFPIQRIQTDRGREFFAVNVQKKLMELGIKFRPNKPASSTYNGKVERSQRTDKEEFYPTVTLDLEALDEPLAEWQHYYNWNRAHGALKGLTPMEMISKLSDETPFWDQAHGNYDITKERIQDAHYQIDLALRKLKLCM